MAVAFMFIIQQSLQSQELSLVYTRNEIRRFGRSVSISYG
jgi:hypothetical protein